MPSHVGAVFHAFNHARVKNASPFDEIVMVKKKGEIWSCFLYFTKPIVNTSERVNACLSMHPNNSLVANMRGVARIFHHTDGLMRFLKKISSAVNGITFC